jgi:hypothetical protein
LTNWKRASQRWRRSSYERTFTTRQADANRNVEHVPLLRRIGSLERFEQGIADAVAEGTMCPVDGPFIAKCVRKWVTGTAHVQYGNVVDSSTPPKEPR